MSSFTNLIGSAFKQIWDDAIDALLEVNALTTPCLLITGTDAYSKCPNCIFDPITNRSRNIYNGTGPIPFGHGICPYCHGWGVPVNSNTTQISLMVIWHYKDFIGFGPSWQGTDDNNMMQPFGTIQTICDTSLVNTIRSTREILINAIDENPTITHRFGRIGEPNPVGLDGTTKIITTWKRLG